MNNKKCFASQICEFSRSVLCLSFFPPCTKQSAEEAAGSWFDEAEYVI